MLSSFTCLAQKIKKVSLFANLYRHMKHVNLIFELTLELIRNSTGEDNSPVLTIPLNNIVALLRTLLKAHLNAKGTNVTQPWSIH